jgi:anti-sigma B factor antagonist
MPDADHGSTESCDGLWAFRLVSVRDGDVHLIALAGELDRWTIEAVEYEIDRVARTGAPSIVLDLRELEFISCSGLRLIVLAHRREPGRLSIVKGSRHVHHVFELCGLVGTLTLVDELPDEVVVGVER